MVVNRELEYHNQIVIRYSIFDIRYRYIRDSLLAVTVQQEQLPTVILRQQNTAASSGYGPMN